MSVYLPRCGVLFSNSVERHSPAIAARAEADSAWDLYTDRAIARSQTHAALCAPAGDKRLVAQLQSLPSPVRGNAITLGNGASHSVNLLLQKGYNVTDIDINHSALVHTARYTSLTDNAAMYRGFHSNFVAYPWDKVASEIDFIHAQNALYFCSSLEELQTFLQQLDRSLAPGGRILADFLGIRDGWVSGLTRCPVPVTAIPRETLEAFFAAQSYRFKIDESEEEGPLAAGGTKWWHVLTITAQKKPTGKIQF